MQALETTVKAALEFARQFSVGYMPAPAVALLAGSRAKGTAKPGSDYDLVLLYSDLSNGARREMVSHENAVFEIFAHDLRTLKYFLHQIELPSGEASLASMVDEGISILGAGSVIESHARKLARNFLDAGPRPLEQESLAQRRYSITDLADALNNATSDTHRLAIGSALYPALGHFVLLANERWTATGKALPAALHRFNPDLEDAFTSAFGRLYSHAEHAPVQDLITRILHPFGGRLRAGFRQQAPASWRD